MNYSFIIYYSSRSCDDMESKKIDSAIVAIMVLAMIAVAAIFMVIVLVVMNYQTVKISAGPVKVELNNGLKGESSPTEIIIPLEPSPTSTSLNVINGLVAYYPFEGNADDESGHESHGAAYNGVTYINDKRGKVAHFDGVDDYIMIKPRSDVSAIGDFTISAWTYLENWKHQTSSNMDRQYIFDGHADINMVAPAPDFYRPGFGLVYDGNSIAGISEIHNFIQYDGHEGYLEQNTPMSVKGAWHFVTFVRKGRNDYTYLDGQLVASTYAKNDKRNTPLNMNHAWFIGTFGGNTPDYDGGVFNYSFYGSIDDLAIYQRALSEAEIESLYAESEK